MKKFCVILIYTAIMIPVTPIYADNAVKPGVVDNYDSKPVPRVRVGNSDHYLCGEDVEETGIGHWIENEAGKDVYSWSDPTGLMGNQDIRIIDADAEIYQVQWYNMHGSIDSWKEMNGKFETITNGEGRKFDVPVPKEEVWKEEQQDTQGINRIIKIIFVICTAVVLLCILIDKIIYKERTLL